MPDDTRKKALKTFGSVAWTMFKLGFDARFTDPVDNAADVLRTEMNLWTGFRGDLLRDRDDLDYDGHAKAMRDALMEASGSLMAMPDRTEADRRAAVRAEESADRLYAEYAMLDSGDGD